jgi:putative transposase
VTLPRPVFPNRFLFVTRRCTQRQFLLRPDDETNNAFIYCLGEAAQRFDMVIVGSTMMSNHHHTILYDQHGNEVPFRAHFHKLLAKTQNVLRDHDENFWSSEEPSVIEILTLEDLLAKLIYTFINPVKADLVDEVGEWPGPNFLRALLDGETLEATRPKHFFDPKGKMPKSIKLQVKLPDAFAGDKAAFLAQLRDAIPLVEQHYRTQRENKGRCVLGAERVKQQLPCHKPETAEPRRALRPRFSTLFWWIRKEALRRYAKWQQEYRNAREALKRGEPIPFPYGTYWLRRVANVTVGQSQLRSHRIPLLN